MPLIIISLKGGHTHTHMHARTYTHTHTHTHTNTHTHKQTHTYARTHILISWARAILRNQAHVSLGWYTLGLIKTPA